MTQEVEGEATICAVCGREWHEEDGDRVQWLSVEITRADVDGNAGWLYESFCTQDHASAWLSAPLPPVEPTAAQPRPRSWRERLATLVFGFCMLWALGLMLLGSYAFVRLLGGWD